MPRIHRMCMAITILAALVTFGLARPAAADEPPLSELQDQLAAEKARYAEITEAMNSSTDPRELGEMRAGLKASRFYIRHFEALIEANKLRASKDPAAREKAAELAETAAEYKNQALRWDMEPALQAARRAMAELKRRNADPEDADYQTARDDLRELERQALNAELEMYYEMLVRLQERKENITGSLVDDVLSAVNRAMALLKDASGEKKINPEILDLCHARARRVLDELHRALQNQKAYMKSDEDGLRAAGDFEETLEARARLFDLLAAAAKGSPRDKFNLEGERDKARNELTMLKALTVVPTASVTPLKGKETLTATAGGASGSIDLKGLASVPDLEAAWRDFLTTLSQGPRTWTAAEAIAYGAELGTNIERVREAELILLLELASGPKKEEIEAMRELVNRREQEIEPLDRRADQLERDMKTLDEHFAANMRNFRRSVGTDEDALFRAWNAYWLFQKAKEELLQVQEKASRARDLNSTLMKRVQEGMLSRGRKKAEDLSIRVRLGREGTDRMMEVPLRDIHTKEELTESLGADYLKRVLTDAEYSAWLASTTRRNNAVAEMEKTWTENQRDFEAGLERLRKEKPESLRNRIDEYADGLDVDPELRDKAAKTMMEMILR
ncbi:MAG: hypothetical protein RDV41_01075 [Planctomycetota bacterium]|nr:hypothetical protein [Planctomycetota bacterium]